jgi:hypothetical protein
MKVDVLSFMKKGTPFLKYGQHGYPHFRQFQLSSDNTRLQWFSQSKSLKNTTISICDMDEIRIGQTTPTFAKHRAPELSKSSFSVLYNHGKTLDVIAKDPNEFKLWTEGLRQLIEISKHERPDALENLKSKQKIKYNIFFFFVYNE